MASSIFRNLNLVIFILFLILHHLIFLLFTSLFFLLTLLTLSLRVPVDSPQHQSLELLDRPGASLDDDQVRQVWGHDLVGDQAEAAHVKLLSVHIDLELQVGLLQGVYFEDSDAALVIHKVTLVFATHLRLTLLSGQFVVLVSL